MQSFPIRWETPDELRIASLQYERELSRHEDELLWDELEASAPNDFIGFLSPEMEKESQDFWNQEYARHMAAEKEIAALLSEMADVEPNDSGWDGNCDLGRGSRG